MNTDFILRYTLENGGGTFELNGMPTKRDKGYVVGIHQGNWGILGLDNTDLFGEMVNELLQQYNFTNIFVGTWLSGGNIVIDPVVIVENLELAKVLAFMAEQEAIYDLKAQKVINLADGS